MIHLPFIGFKNFRSFAKDTRIDLADLTVLTGPNSSGKSSVLKALQLLKANKGALEKLDFTDQEHKLGNYALSVHKNDTKRNMHFEVPFKIELVDMVLELEYKLDTTNELKFGLLHRFVIKFAFDNKPILTATREADGRYASKYDVDEYCQLQLILFQTQIAVWIRYQEISEMTYLTYGFDPNDKRSIRLLAMHWAFFDQEEVSRVKELRDFTKENIINCGKDAASMKQLFYFTEAYSHYGRENNYIYSQSSIKNHTLIHFDLLVLKSIVNGQLSDTALDIVLDILGKENSEWIDNMVKLWRLSDEEKLTFDPVAAQLAVVLKEAAHLFLTELDIIDYRKLYLRLTKESLNPILDLYTYWKRSYSLSEFIEIDLSTKGFSGFEISDNSLAHGFFATIKNINLQYAEKLEFDLRKSNSKNMQIVNLNRKNNRFRCLPNDLVSKLSDHLRPIKRSHFLEAVRANTQRTYTWQSQGTGFNQLLLALMQEKAVWRVAFIEKWLKEFEIAQKFEIKPLIQGLGAEVLLDGKPLADFGYGVTQFVPILLKIVLIAFEDDTTQDEHFSGLLYIEEPETNLHPKLQSKLADLFMDAIKTFNMQIIVETHSEYLIRKLQYLTAQKKIKPEETVIHYFNDPKEKLPKGEPQVKKITIAPDGRLSGEFGAGFYDETARLMMAMLTGETLN
jgi:predicted ATPase